MNNTLAPSRCTVYVSNFAFSLTNNDLYQIFTKYGPVVKVTILKDKNRRSKGVAFIQFQNRESASHCARALDGKEMHGRTLKCSLAKDNGRSAEFIKKKYYPDKTSCYECGEDGHLSYQCPKNLLGSRDPPKKKLKKKKKQMVHDEEDQAASETEEEPDLETLSAAIQLEFAKSGSVKCNPVEPKNPKKRIIKNAYFSDEEDVSD